MNVECRLGRTLVITEVESIEEWWWSAASAASGRGRVLLVARRDALAAPPHVRASLAPLNFAARLHTLIGNDLPIKIKVKVFND